MMSWKRVGHGLLALGGCAVAALMVYNVLHDGAARTTPSGWPAAQPAAEVVVFFPEHPLWHEFRQGVDACSRRQRARILGAGQEWVEIQTPRHGHRIRFVLNDVRGVRETKEAVERIAARPAPPIAVIGSSNTVLTAALAEALRRQERDGRASPLLLVPWATAVLAERAEPGHAPVAFLDIDPDRTFRFCPNNQVQANLLTRSLLRDATERPARVDAIVDRLDPYSVDLADSFHRVLERRLPETELVEHAETVHALGPWHVPELPSVAEDALAESIWRAAERARRGSTHWVILPLQAEPARRMLLALQRHARGHTSENKAVPLRVLCGDGIGTDTLGMLAGHLPFPVWCYSPGLAPCAGEGENTPDPILSTDAAVLAEIVAAVVYGLDAAGPGPPSAGALRDRLRGLDLPAGDPAGLGRSLTLAPSGERIGKDLGHVLLIRPGSDVIYATAEDPSGHWSAPRAVMPALSASHP